MTRIQFTVTFSRKVGVGEITANSVEIAAKYMYGGSSRLLESRRF
jgi:hypothetical protein